MLTLGKQLDLKRCPHCGVNSPNLFLQQHLETTDADKNNRRVWGIYICRRCGGVVTAFAGNLNTQVSNYFPAAPEVDESIPDRAKAYLQQATESVHVPAGGVMLAASSVDAMLKEKGLVKGSLYSRIDEAKKQSIITKEMADWAHSIRLDANNQRHSDESVSLPTGVDAMRCIEFASALAQLLFVLPNRIERGLSDVDA